MNNKLHTAICQAVAFMNQEIQKGNNLTALRILRVALAQYDDDLMYCSKCGTKIYCFCGEAYSQHTIGSSCTSFAEMPHQCLS